MGRTGGAGRTVAWEACWRVEKGEEVNEGPTENVNGKSTESPEREKGEEKSQKASEGRKARWLDSRVAETEGKADRQHGCREGSRN